MGKGISILIWDSFGIGLNKINARLVSDENNNNWFSYNTDQDKKELISKLTEGAFYFKVID